MRPNPGEVLHFSEDPTIRQFAPKRAKTQHVQGLHVWAVDWFHAPSYWFPRQCPRAMAWLTPGATTADIAHHLGPGTERVHIIESGWLDRMHIVDLYTYRFDAALFRSIGDGYAQVCDHEVDPLGPPEQVSDLLEIHREAGIPLITVDNLWPIWRKIVDSTLGHSGIRLGNALPHPIKDTFH
jgi:hypothetical protein